MNKSKLANRGNAVNPMEREKTKTSASSTVDFNLRELIIKEKNTDVEALAKNYDSLGSW